ncbi:AAA family ATPase [Actinoplanes sp. NPDC051494]|uniref:AAA family ATPase n=1 Tax=Actinoplanes sp. NPDC051494 TaxID=3363907 RepID=UPI0037AFFC19
MQEPSGSPRLRILGSLRLWLDGTEVETGPQQQTYLLALLLVQHGRPVGTAELIDLLWGRDAPGSALNVIHKYVGALRRVLEPGLPARGSSRWLHRIGDGYQFTAAAGMLDLTVFRERVQRARIARERGQDEAALDHYGEALALWHGRAGEGLTLTAAAMPVFAALDAEFLSTCLVAAELAVALRTPRRALPALHLAASMAPLDEAVQAMLVTVLGAAGHQAEALTTFQRVRIRLDEELGVRPGPALRDAQRLVLIRPPEPADSPPADSPPAAPGPAAAVPPGRPGIPVGPPAAGLVGRVEELGALRQTVSSALAGRTACGIVEGEPGAGKTRVLLEVAAEAERRGALVARGACLDGAGTPSMWPWVQVIGAVVNHLPAADRDGWLAGELGRLVEGRGDLLAAPVLPDNGTPFRLFEQVVALIGQVAARRPVLIVIDDLQWADAGSLALFGHLVARMPRRNALIAALRDRAPRPGPELSRTLAAASRVPGHRRIRLGPLGPDEVAELVRRETGHEPGPETSRDIHTRTAGNPFFVRELSRLLTADGVLSDEAAVRARVPATVRDVVLDRMAGLDEDARLLLRTAALIGRDVGIGLLARTAGLDVGACLALLEPVEALGVFESTPDDPFSFRFAHDVVRETLTETTSPARALRLHLLVADALEATGPGGDDVAERLAHHLRCAGPLADPARTAHALVRAGLRAAGKSALEAAEHHLRSAAQLARANNLAELELAALAHLSTVVGMRSMYGFSTPDLLERAEHLARSLGRDVQAAALLYARWAAYAQAMEFDRGAPLARRLLRQGEAATDPFVLACGLQAWGIHQWDMGDIDEAFRYLRRSQPMILDLGRREDDPGRHDLQLLMAGTLAETTALHGDVAAAQALLDRLEAVAGADPYMATVWATFTARIASIVGDPVRALRAADRGIAVDPGFSFVFLGTYQRLARCWSLAMTGTDPAGNAERAAHIIAANLLDPPLSCVATWFGLLAEMHLAAGATDEAAAALDRADLLLARHGQRYPEGLLMLLRARLLHARGESTATVRAAAGRALALSTERGAHLFAHRTERFLRELLNPQ